MEGTARPRRTQKKSLEDALDELRDTGKTAHEFLLQVNWMRKINAVCGFGAVTALDVAQMDEATLEEFDALYEYEKDEGSRAKAKGQYEDYLRQRRAQHPSYRK